MRDLVSPLIILGFMVTIITLPILGTRGVSAMWKGLGRGIFSMVRAVLGVLVQVARQLVLVVLRLLGRGAVDVGRWAAKGPSRGGRGGGRDWSGY